jgi:hypothetical protein
MVRVRGPGPDIGRDLVGTARQVGEEALVDTYPAHPDPMHSFLP